MNKEPTILLIFGISGDLSTRYLLPAIGQIAKAEMLPEKFKIVGITRKSDISTDSLLFNVANKEYLKSHTDLLSMKIDDLEEYEKLKQYIQKTEKEFGARAQKLFYLSTPPLVAKSLVGFLGESGLSKMEGAKLLLEKPFGTNLESAEDLAKYVDKYFSPERVYRIDHYLAKENTQNIIVFRDGNSLFKRTWNNNFIDSIEIIASEKAGIEGRGNFYEQTGALRDVVQSHLLQLAALVLMDLPKDLKEVPNLRYKALKNLEIVCDINDKECIRRGQYKGYKEEVGNPRSNVETFVSLKLTSNDPKWTGVPIILRTGKAIKERLTEIRINYKKDNENESNELVLRIQPDPGIEFSMWAKKPGLELKTNKHLLSFLFREHYGDLPEAYEQVLFSAINGDHNLFTLSEEVLETWRILDTVQNFFENNREDLATYEKGASIEEVLNTI